MRTRKVGVTSLLDQFGEDRRGRFGEDVLKGGSVPDEDRVEAEPAVSMTVVARTRVQKVVSRLKGLLGRLAIAKSTRRPRSVSGSGETGRSRAHLEVDRARSASAEFVLARQAILGPSLAPGESARTMWEIAGKPASDDQRGAGD